MSQWWSYRLEDFLLFSPRVYWRMFELHNAALWPLHLLALALGLGIVVLTLRQQPGHGLWIALVLAALWAFVGVFFFWKRYLAINWAIAYISPAFLLQALMFVVAGSVGGLTFDRRDIAAQLGLALAVIGLTAYALVPLLFGRPWMEAEVFGITPDPTAIVTLGILLMARGRLVFLLLPIPLVWLLLSGVTLHTMGDPQAWLPFAVVGVSVILLALRHIAR